jgi:hypothetical protein
LKCRGLNYRQRLEMEHYLKGSASDETIFIFPFYIFQLIFHILIK